MAQTRENYSATTTKDRVSEACNKLIEMFRTGDIPEAIARTTIQAQAGEQPSNKWSLGNQLLMILSGTTDARGFKQWGEVGRNVKKGAKAFYILGPRTKTIKEKNEKTGEEVKKVILTGFVGIPVFKYEDTEGEEIERPDYTPSELPPLIEVANRFNINVKYGPFTKRFYGYFRPATNNIMLCTHDIKTFFHELGHAIHNTIRPLKGGQDPDQEIVAETVAAVLCQIYGYDGYIYHGYNYISSYANSNNAAGTVKAIMRVMSDVQKVIEIILSSADDQTIMAEVA